MTSSQTHQILKDRAWLRLNLPPELARTVAVYSLIGLAALIALGWGAWRVVRTASAPPTVKIGLVAPFEGLYRTTGYDVLFAVKQAINERNQGQGLNGYRVELVALNDTNDPAEAARQAQALVADPGIVGVVGHLTPETTLAALPVYQAAGLAVVSPWSVGDEAFEFANLVSVVATGEETAARLQTEIEQRGLSPVTRLARPDEPVSPQTQAVVFNADAVTAGRMLLNLPASALLLPKFGLAASGDRQLVQVAGPAADGLIFVSPGPAAADANGGESFSQAYETAAGYPPPPRAVLAYDAAQVLLDSIAKTMNPDNKWYNTTSVRTGIRKNLFETTRIGLTGPIEFEASGRRINAPVWVYQIDEMKYPGSSIGR